MRHDPPTPTPFPYTTLFRSDQRDGYQPSVRALAGSSVSPPPIGDRQQRDERHRDDGGVDQEGSVRGERAPDQDRKSTRLNSSHLGISYAVFCLKKKNNIRNT